MPGIVSGEVVRVDRQFGDMVQAQHLSANSASWKVTVIGMNLVDDEARV